jgi:hypothetical protein
MNRYTIRMRDGSTVVVDGQQVILSDAGLLIHDVDYHTVIVLAPGTWIECTVNDGVVSRTPAPKHLRCKWPCP